MESKQWTDESIFEHDFTDRFRKITYTVFHLGIPIWTAFILADYLYSPQNFILFLWIRLVVLVLNLFVYFNLKNQNLQKLQSSLLLTLTAWSIGVSVIAYNLGGNSASYAAGVNVIGLILTLAPFSRRYFFAAVFAIYGPSVALAIHTYFTLGVWRETLAVSFIWVSTIILAKVFLDVRETQFKSEYEARNALQEERALQAELIKQQAAKLHAAHTNETIARTTQMLAHDVRKPFTILSVLLKTLLKMNLDEEAKELVVETTGEVQQVLGAVDGMIADVLEIGREAPPVLENTSAESLFEFSLSQIFRIYPQSSVSLKYEFECAEQVKCDALRVSRVFGNILSNALQAMNFKGSMWFKTKKQDDFVLFCIGNGGGFITPEKIAKLFDPFFTSGKAGGTGLGLAIVKKIVEAHGGKVWCESNEQLGVEFWFTLPCAQSTAGHRYTALPSHSSEFVKLSQFDPKAKLDHDGYDLGILSELEREVAQRLQTRTSTFKILILEDEAIYRNFVVGIIQKFVLLAPLVEVSAFARVSEANHYLKSNRPELIILDIGLEHEGINGLEFLRSIRSAGFTGKVCVHSNRTAVEDLRDAIEAGADSVIPKPLAVGQLLGLI